MDGVINRKDDRGKRKENVVAGWMNKRSGRGKNRRSNPSPFY